MLTLSPSAVEAVDQLLHTPEMPDDAGLRIRPAGESQLTIEVAAEPAPGDQVAFGLRTAGAENDSAGPSA